MSKNKVLSDHAITVSHPDKLYFPESQITKNDVINYYKKIANYFLMYVKDHLIVMQRFPNGITQEGFYHKQVPDYFPSWINRKTIDLKKGDLQTLLLINDEASLVYLANQGVLVFHSWLSSVTHINTPDKIVFDLDPTSNSLSELRFAAKKLKTVIESHNLIPYIMTSGSRGYHVVVPIIPEFSFEKVHDFARHICHTLVEKYPSRFTVKMDKSKRKGKIFLDYLRNSYGQTSVACYSLRAREGAPIATPIEWSELSKTAPQKYTIKNIFKRLSRKSDPWRNFWEDAKKLKFPYI